MYNKLLLPHQKRQDLKYDESGGDPDVTVDPDGGDHGQEDGKGSRGAQGELHLNRQQ